MSDSLTADRLNNWGNVLVRRGQHDEAVNCYRIAIALKPDSEWQHSNLGNALNVLGLFDEAVTCCRRAIALRPDFADAYNNLGIGLAGQNRLDEAVTAYQRAIGLKPDCAKFTSNLGLALLARGDLVAGWTAYEARWATQQTLAYRHGLHLRLSNRRRHPAPQWLGEPAEGRTLLIHSEAGFGDALQFCRYAPLAAAHGLRVIIEAPKQLAQLLRGLPGVDRVIARGEALPDFDLHCPMMSLPYAMRDTMPGVPSGTPYLHANEAQVTTWQERLDAMDNQGLRVGLVWAGSPRPGLPALAAIDRRRSMAPDHLAPLVSLPGVHFISLQKDGPMAPPDFMLTNVMDEMTDFADTAALIANLDLIISVDTAVAHLAGALGKPVWLLDRHDPCWRWMQGTVDSPWYPTLRIYRQKTSGDWAGVIGRVKQDFMGHRNIVMEENSV